MKHFHINAGVRLPDNFEGNAPEALAYLLYEMMRTDRIDHKNMISPPENTNPQEIVAWLSKTGEDLWYQSSLYSIPEFLTEDYQDFEDEEIASAIIEHSDVSEDNPQKARKKILKKRKL